MAITSAVSDLVKSFYEILASIFGAAYNVVHGVISVILGFFTGIFNLFAGIIKETLHATGSTGKFVIRKFPGSFRYILFNRIYSN